MPGADALVGGGSAFYLDTKIASERDNKVIIPIVLVVVFIILMLLLRALLAPLILLGTVILSFGAALGISSVLFTEVFTRLSGLLHRLVRIREGRCAQPSAGAIDAQSVKTSGNVPATDQGIDAAKKIVGRKRSIVVDTLGLLLAVLVTAASVQDSIAGTTLINQIAGRQPALRAIWVDGGYRQHLVEHAAAVGIEASSAATSWLHTEPDGLA